MRLVFVSDLHANAAYLDAVTQKIAAHKPDEIYCLGDLVDYYDDPNTVIEWCQKNVKACIKGNHDKYVLGELTPKAENIHLYRVEEQKAVLKPQNLQYLASLPEYLDLTIDDKRFYLTHSLPNDCVSYLRDPNQLDRDFLKPYDVYAYGHTHIPVIQYHYGTLLLNPGSVGQPRDYSRQPSFAVLDTGTLSYTIQKVDVDVAAYSKSLASQGFDASMINILEREKIAHG